MPTEEEENEIEPELELRNPDETDEENVEEQDKLEEEENEHDSSETESETDNEDKIFNIKSSKRFYDDIIESGPEDIEEEFEQKRQRVHIARINEKISYREAISGEYKEEWQKAIESELNSLLKNQTWEEAILPPGRKAIKNKWVFKVKENMDGEIIRFKARLVGKGFTQKEGIDYYETFAPVIRHDSLRILFAIINTYDLELIQCDIETAYLYGELEEEIYMEYPEGIEKKNPNSVLRLKKGLYGLKQSAHLWNKTFTKQILKLGLKQSKVDPCIFYNIEKDRTLTILAIYVDDMIIASKSKKRIHEIINGLKEAFKIKVVSEENRFYIIGNEITRDRKQRKLIMSQQKYIKEKLEEFGMAESKGISTPRAVNCELTKLQCPKTDEELEEMKHINYRSAVGSLIHAANNTRFDISEAVGVVARYFENPGLEHWKAVKRIFRYLKETADFALVFDGNLQGYGGTLPIGYVDASHASCLDDRKSVTGYIFIFGGSAICWNSKKQQTVALSTAEAEYMALANGVQQSLWIKNLLNELNIGVGQSFLIKEDNQACISIGNNLEHNSRTKHIDIKHHFIRDRIQSGEIKLEYVPSKHMLADIFTKALPRDKFVQLRSACGMVLNQPGRSVEISTSSKPHETDASDDINDRQKRGKIDARDLARV